MDDADNVATVIDQCAADQGNIWCILQAALDGVVAFAWPAATALAGVGILTMALIEIANGALRIRPKFRRKGFETIFITQFPKDESTNCRDACAAFALLQALLSYGDPLTIYEDDLKSFVSKMAAAFRTALGNATVYENVIIGLAPRIDDDTLTTLKAGPGTDPRQKESFAQAKAMAMGMNQHFLDSVSTQLANRWERTTQAASILLSIATIGLLATYYYWDRKPGPPIILFWTIIAVFGGTVAPVAKNIVTALRNVKNLGS